MKNILIKHQIISFFQNLDIIGFRKLGNNLPQILLKKPTVPQVIQTLHGFKLYIDPIRDNGIEKEIYYTGTYEKGTLHVLNHILKSNDVFVDVGANIGLISIYAAQKVGSKGIVHAYEANPETFTIMENNIELNELHNIIKPLKIAIGASEGKGLIFDNWEVNRGAETMFQPKEKSSSHEVAIKPLDSLLRPNSKIKAIKIDVEGFELEVIKGAKNILNKPNAPILIVEYSEECLTRANQTIQELTELISSCNKYTFYKLTRKKGRVGQLIEIQSIDQLNNNDNFFCFLKEHTEAYSNLFK